MQDECGDLGDLRAVESNDLPKDAVILAAIDQWPRISPASKGAGGHPFIGPAILSSRAAGVFFRIFGHRVEV